MQDRPAFPFVNIQNYCSYRARRKGGGDHPPLPKEDRPKRDLRADGRSCRDNTGFRQHSAVFRFPSHVRIGNVPDLCLPAGEK